MTGMPDELKQLLGDDIQQPTDGVVLDPSKEGGAALVVPPANQESNKTPEPTLAETIAAEMTKLMDPINQRFDAMGQALEEVKSARTPTQEPPKAAEPQKWQPKSWDDFPALVQQLGREAAEGVIKEREDAAKAASKAAEDAQKQIDDQLDVQVAQLEKAGKLPEVKNVQDQNDPGKEARRELFGFALYLGTPNLVQAQEVLDKIHVAGNKFDHRVGQIIQGPQSNPGKNAPVGSSSAAAGTGGPTAPKYDDIHKMRSLDDIVSKYG